jgi:hypothetical protein
MLDSESVSSLLGRFTEIRDELAVVGEIVDPGFMVRTALNSFSKPWGPLVRGIVAREVMPTWERLWDNFVQEETRLTSESLGQQRITKGDEDLALWTKGKKKTDRGAKQCPNGGVRPQLSGGGQERDMSTREGHSLQNSDLMGAIISQVLSSSTHRSRVINSALMVGFNAPKVGLFYHYKGPHMALPFIPSSKTYVQIHPLSIVTLSVCHRYFSLYLFPLSLIAVSTMPRERGKSKHGSGIARNVYNRRHLQSPSSSISYSMQFSMDS